ncbi:hypothetical protein, partial [Phytohabitans suffuscus]
GGAAARAATLPAAGATVDAARGAVTEPSAETAARAGAALAEALGERPAPSPEIVALCDRIRTAIREKRPVDEDQLTKADPQGAARDAGQALSSSVEGDAARVQGSYAALDNVPPGQPAQTPTPLEAPPAAVAGSGVAGGSAAPDPIPAQDLSLDADRDRVEQRAADARIERHSTEPLRSQPPFSTVREGRAELTATAQTGPAQVAAQQQAAIAQAQADMASLQEKAVAALNASRGGTVTTVSSGQTGMVGQEEQTRESVSRRAQQIFDGARTQVDQLLQPVSRTALARWDAGVTQLSQGFKDRLAEVQKWIDERHSGVGGAIVGLWDAVAGLPDWVTEEYDKAEARFGDGVCELLLSISSDVNGVIAAAEAVIDNARSQIRELFASLPAELREWAATEQAKFETQLDGLKERAQQTRTQFVTDVSERATKAVAEVQAEVERLREAARGLIGKIADAIQAFVDDPVKAIINGLLTIVGIPPASFWALVEKIGQVIEDIAEDPETFVNNLVAALRLGFEQFFDHFGTHVLNGFWKWLFSGLGSVGVQIPPDFSLGSLVTFILQVMGLTWPKIREILVRHIGAQNVELIEKAWQLVSLLIEKGPEGIVEMLKEKLDPATIVRTILEAAVEFLVDALVKQVAIRVIGMLNPAGAVLQAIELIYKVLKWVFENAARIFALVETVVNAIADVMAGRLGQVATAIEMSLAGLIPLVIDFLAGLLGLGDLPQEIAAVIGRLQAMVLAVVERVIVALVVRGRALLAALGVGGGKPGEGGGDGDEELGTTVRFRGGGESHRLWVDLSGQNATLMVASVPKAVADKIAEWRGRIAANVPADEAARAEASSLLAQLGPMTDSADKEGDRLAKDFLKARTDRDPAHPPPSDDDLENRERAIAAVLERLFELFGEQPDPLLRFAAQLEAAHGVARPSIEAPLKAKGAQLPTSWKAARDVAEDDATIKEITRAPLNQDGAWGAFAHPWAAEATLTALEKIKADAPGETNVDARRRMLSTLTRVNDNGGVTAAGASDYLVRYKRQLHEQEPPFDKAPSPVSRVREMVWRKATQGPAKVRITKAMEARARLGIGPPPGPDLPSRVRLRLWQLLRGATLKVSGTDVVDITVDAKTDKAIAEYLEEEIKNETPEMQRCLRWWRDEILSMEWHHAWPQWLGGAFEQLELRIPFALHMFDGIVGAGFPGGFHPVFNDLYRAHFGLPVNDEAAWTAYEAANQATAKRDLRTLLVEAYKIVFQPFGAGGADAKAAFIAELGKTYPEIKDQA